MMTTELLLRITLQKPPAGVNFGLQKGSGNNFETIQVKTSSGDDLKFNLIIQIKGDPAKDSEPKFSGPFVQGPTDGKFLYIDIGTLASQVTGWSRRLKIPLIGITWDVITKASNGIETTVPGTAKDGGPNCATVKPFAGWKLIT